MTAPEQKQKVDTRRLDEQYKTKRRELCDTYDIIKKSENSLSQIARQLADILKEKMVILGQEEWINQICTYICKDVHKDYPDPEDQNRLSMLISNALDNEFKTTALELSSLRSLNVSDLPVECYIQFVKIMEAFKILKMVYPEGVSIPGFQDLAQELYDNKNRLEKLAVRYGIPLPYEKKDLPGEKKPSIRLEPESIPDDEKLQLAQNKKVSHWNEIRDAAFDRMIRLGPNMITKGKQFTGYNYISRDLVIVNDTIFRKEAFILLDRPLQDMKWQRDWGDWSDILEDYHDQGGTYASSKSAVDTDIINEKTGKPLQRKITKEQIDAKHDPYLNAMCFMVRQLKPNNKILGNAGRREMDKIQYYEDQKTHEKFVKIEKYKLTHEQLKPNYEHFNPLVRSIIDEFRQLINYRPDEEDDYREFRSFERKKRARRSVDLHDVLSEAA